MSDPDTGGRASRGEPVELRQSLRRVGRPSSPEIHLSQTASSRQRRRAVGGLREAGGSAGGAFADEKRGRSRRGESVLERQARETHGESGDRGGRGNEIPVEAGGARIVVDEPEGAPGGVAVGADGSAAFDEEARVARLVEKEVLE